MVNIRLVGLVVLFVAGIISAATCAEKSYAASCSKCSFDENGKMDTTCYNNEQSAGKTCLFAAYPIESMEYGAGNCPAIDVCVDRLTTCKALYSSGDDQLDCETGNIRNCFVQGDICVAEAVKNCSGTPPAQPAFDVPPAGWCDSFWFMIIPLFIGTIVYKKARVSGHSGK